LDFHSRCSRCANASQEARLLTEAAEMPLDEMRLMLEQWGNITGEPRGVDYTEVLGSWTPASNGWSDVEQGEVCYLLVDRP
jgi:hypothetical protein